jgi:hypothetical protein
VLVVVMGLFLSRIEGDLSHIMRAVNDISYKTDLRYNNDFPGGASSAGNTNSGSTNGGSGGAVRSSTPTTTPSLKSDTSTKAP